MLIESAQVREVKATGVRLGVAAVHADRARDLTRDVEELVKRVCGRAVPVRFEVIEDGAATAEMAADGVRDTNGPAASGAGAAAERTTDASEPGGLGGETSPAGGEPAAPEVNRESVENHPLIRRAKELFGARVVAIHPRRPTA